MRFFFTVCCFLSGHFLFGQDAVSEAGNPWKKQVRLGVNVAQTAVSKAWKGGGSNNLVIGLLVNADAAYQVRQHRWTNVLQLQYGFLNAPGQGGLRKNNDRIFFDSKYSRPLNTRWHAFAGLTFLSQFGQGINYQSPQSPISSSFMAPGYLFESVGVEYAPTTYFSVQLGLATLRQTFVTDARVQQDIPGNYGVTPGKTLLNELGSQVVINFAKDVVTNLNLRLRYGLLAAYLPNLKAPDHRLDLTATGRVNNFLNVNFTLIGIYDDDIVQAVQVSEGLAVGLNYAF